MPPNHPNISKYHISDNAILYGDLGDPPVLRNLHMTPTEGDWFQHRQKGALAAMARPFYGSTDWQWIGQSTQEKWGSYITMKHRIINGV